MTHLVLALLTAVVQASGAKDIESVEVTVYNQNFGLVKEVRTMTLERGVNSIAVEDVAASIDPSTVHFEAVGNPDAVAILEQNYQYDLLGPRAILNKSAGKKVRLHRTLPDGKKEIVEGTLLAPPYDAPSYNPRYNPSGVYVQPDQGMIIRADDGRILINPSGEVEVLELPEGLIPVPTLFWTVGSDIAGRQRAELSYITDNITWRADYIAVLNQDDTELSLDGWVTLTNNCGATFRDAKLKLVGGDVRRIRPQMQPQGYGGYGGAEMMVGRGQPQFEEQGIFEYHLYTLQRPTTIKDKEIKQVALLHASDVSAKKLLFYEGQGPQWRYRNTNWQPGQGSDTDPNTKVNVVVEIMNSQENNLGMPLPKGLVRAYKADQDGQLQFLGEDEIDHTPRDEKARLYIGDAFDVRCTRARTDYKVIASNVFEYTIEVTARNHKDTPVTLVVAEHPYADWEVLSKSHEFEKVDAHTIHFTVELQPDEEETVTYTVRCKF